MQDSNKLKVLTTIAQDIAPGTLLRLSFNKLSKELQLSKPELDMLLMELNKERYISQYAKKGVDSFTLLINQQGLDAVQDEGF